MTADPTLLTPINLVVIQPMGQMHALGFLDQVRYLRHQLRRLGCTVSVSKSRLREDALNIVFGTHLGFPREWAARHACIVFNLEQLGDGGATVAADYVELLAESPVIDYDHRNLAAYGADPRVVPVVRFLHAPYLTPPTVTALEDRPIDLLFFGTLNPRRKALFERIKACGVEVTTFERPVFGPERDEVIRRAKAVLNCHFYDSSCFEQARCFHALSLGTPVVSERRSATRVPDGFEEAVSWFDDITLETFFDDDFATPAFFDAARRQLAAFAKTDPLDDYRRVLALATEVAARHAAARRPEPWCPQNINLGSGADYRPGWLNLDILDRAEPDLVLDLAASVTLPVQRPTRLGGEVRLEAGQLHTIYANNVLEHVPDLPTLMGNALALLKLGGRFEIEVPFERSLTAWQDPTHVRALNQNTWLYFTDWFWYVGWFEHRFELAKSRWLDMNRQPCAKAEAAFMHVVLRKIVTTPAERTQARTMRPDFGGLADDGPVADARS